MIEIRLISKEELPLILPLLELLNPKTAADILQQRLREMEVTPYQCAGAFEDGELVGICGLWILHKVYIGKHLEPDNVVILPTHRGKRVGEALMAWVEEYGRQQGCHAAELNCYVSNPAGLKFWITRGYQIVGYHCRKML